LIEAAADRPPGPLADAEMLLALRRGEEAAFIALVERHHASMVRVARGWLGNRALAEEAAQEAWLGALEGMARFEGRSSVRTWLFGILANCARQRAAREGRSVPLSSLEPEGDAAALEPSRFLADDHPRWPGHWARAPEPWAEEQLATRETAEAARRAIEDLPPSQRQVITLRDVEGFSAEEACAVLGLSEGNQRVLLHRARARVRAALERHLQREEP
jgi:RNA polymerase sigma-70 factor (ECF subfamily)